MNGVGIVAAAGYVPRYRLTGRTLAGVWGAGGTGERAVAGYDEDSLTMAADAALRALAGRDPSRLGACLLATTSPPYLEKSSATLLATVADLPAEVVTADLGGSLRAGTTALRLGLDMVRAGSAVEVLVAAADLRPVAPGSPEEATLGDAAAAFVLGSGEEVIARLEAAHTVSREFSDVWRLAGDRYLTVLADAAFVRARGLDRHLSEAVEGLLGRAGRKREDIAAVVVYGPDARTQAALVKQLRFPDAAVRSAVMARAGNTGVAAVPLELVAALETAAPGERILVVAYGNGAEALLFETTDRVARRGPGQTVAAQLAAGRPLEQYGRYLQFRRHVETEVIRAFTSVPTLVREEKQDLRLYGQKCAACGAVSYPRRHLCWQCSSDRLEDHRLSRRGRVFTFTRDHLVPNPDPPTVMVTADLEGGGRFYTQLVDCDPAAVTFDLPVELCLRRIHEGEGLVNYFWKFRPAA